MNLIVLHACEMVGLSDRAPFAFLQTQATPVDRAFAGFFHMICFEVMVFDNGTETGTLTTIDQHARKIDALLAQGFTIQEAIARTESIYKPRTRGEDGSYTYEPMQVRGDGDTRLTSVCTGTSPKASTDWCKFQ